MAKEVNQKLKQELNEDGELVKLWGKGDYKIPVRIDLDAMKENGFLSGVTKETLHKKRVCNRTEQVVYVRGSKEMYDFVMTSYSNEYKAEDRDRRCLIDNGKGKLIRCPERVKNSITGKMESNSCQKCVYYNSLDKKIFIRLLSVIWHLEVMKMIWRSLNPEQLEQWERENAIIEF